MILDSLPNAAKLTITLVISLAAGGIGVIFTSPSIESWYSGLVRPVFTPPNWLFAPAWTTLYILMGVAAYFVWK
jgi:benzodiazapine receptor